MVPLLVGMLCALALPHRAEAQFTVCNQSFDVVNLAVGTFETDAFVTRGWWTIGPNQCANVIRDPLQARFVYVFAQDVFGNSLLTGVTSMCVAPERFMIRGERDCLMRGHLAADFLEVDTLRNERWTLFLGASP
ncbi:MAG: DUF1036 domain-containing protein [Rubellimicrobium sp.]|nr:DUF1036 domain-containing protein [Rubellimicrobium sp.]